MDKDFTESAFADSLKRGMPIVHIASHFRLTPGNVGDSYLLLGNGDHLSLEKVHAGAFKFESVEQLTLSACNTAMHVEENAGREMEGLGVVAQKKGAKSVMATLWAIDDNATGVFMPRFYELLLEKNISKAEALRQVQAEFIEGKLAAGSAAGRNRGKLSSAGNGTEPAKAFPGTSHPYYWAPFILMGNWL
jgi:CHAT domain-containing protein